MVDLASMEKGEKNVILARWVQMSASKRRAADTSRYGWTLTTLTSEAVQSCWRTSIRCIGGMEMPRYSYAYLHGVDGSSSPTEKDRERYPESNGWPEWFSLGCTLQETTLPPERRPILEPESAT